MMTPRRSWSSSPVTLSSHRVLHFPLLLVLTCGLLGELVEAQQCPNECSCLGTFVTCYQFTQDSLRNLPTGANTLVLSGGNVSSFPPGFARQFPQLTLLDIQFTFVETILNGTFSGLKELKQLAVTDSQFGRIEAGAFEDISAVSQILFSGSEIGTIHSGAFSDLTNIGVFSIWSSKIERIETGAFRGFSGLDSLSFYENNVTTIHRDAFVNIENLGKVDVYMNKFYNAQGSAVMALQAATSDMNMYSNTFPCNCGVLRAFNTPLLARYLVSQKCVRDGQVTRLSNMHVDDLCSNLPSSTESSSTAPSSTAGRQTATPGVTTPYFKTIRPIKVTQIVYITTSPSGGKITTSSSRNGGKARTTSPTSVSRPSLVTSTPSTTGVSGRGTTGTGVTRSGSGQSSGQMGDSSSSGKGASWITQVTFVSFVTTLIATWLISAC